MKFSHIVIWAGIYGMYAAKYLGEKGHHVALLEYDSRPFERATFINQARLHSGYHYPRSKETAAQTIKYFKRFQDDFDFAINKEFKKIYAISEEHSLVNADEFQAFCDYFKIKCQEVDKSEFFKKGKVERAFDTFEYGFDAKKIRDFFHRSISEMPNVEIFYGSEVSEVEVEGTDYVIKDRKNDRLFSAPVVINATYASVNQMIAKFGFTPFEIKYEMCEVILCEASEKIKNVWLTVMDGPFFSVMPFGMQGIHSLTSVAHTPHSTSYGELPTFDCQKKNPRCSKTQLENCNLCKFRPNTAWNKMSALASDYLVDDIGLTYKESLFSIKPILLLSETDDSRPTLIRKFGTSPTFVSVLSGKINTFYELDEVLNEV